MLTILSSLPNNSQNRKSEWIAYLLDIHNMNLLLQDRVSYTSQITKGIRRKTHLYYSTYSLCQLHEKAHRAHPMLSKENPWKQQPVQI